MVAADGWVWRHFRNLLSSRLLFHSDPFTNGGQPFKCADTLTDSIWKHWQLCSNSSENSLFVPCSGNFKLMWRLTIVAYDCVIKNLRLVSLFWRKCFFRIFKFFPFLPKLVGGEAGSALPLVDLLISSFPPDPKSGSTWNWGHPLPFSRPPHRRQSSDGTKQ